MKNNTEYSDDNEMVRNPFIQQTAVDYDMSYEVVDYICNVYWDKGLFYDKLEEFIAERSKKNSEPTL